MKNDRKHLTEREVDRLTDATTGSRYAARDKCLLLLNLPLISGRSSVTPEMAIRLEKALGSTADTWLRMQMNHDLAQMRKRSADITVERLTPKVA